MLTNNWRNILARQFKKTQQSRKWDGTIATLASASLDYNRRFYIGTGATVPNQTDYKLEKAISEDKYISSMEIVCDTGDGSFLKESGLYASGTVTNTSTEPLEVSEIGLAADTSNAKTEDIRYLLAREVFHTPITILPGGVQAFSLKLF